MGGKADRERKRERDRDKKEKMKKGKNEKEKMWWGLGENRGKRLEQHTREVSSKEPLILRALLWKMNYKDKASYGSSPPVEKTRYQKKIG